MESRHGRQVGVLQARHRAVGVGELLHAPTWPISAMPISSSICRRRRSTPWLSQAEGNLDASPNSVTFIPMNNQIPPFDNVNVRRAIAFALPYDDMFKAALFGRGTPLFGATWADDKPSSGAYPIPQPVKLDLGKATEYLKEAGLPDGFRPLSASMSARLQPPNRWLPWSRNRSPRSASASISRNCRTRRCRRNQREEAALFHRGHCRLAALDRLFLPQFLHRQSALELLTDQQSGTGGDRAEGSLRDPTRPSTRKTARSSTPSTSRDAADTALAAARTPYGVLARRPHLPVSPPADYRDLSRK